MRPGILIIAVVTLSLSVPNSGLASWPYDGGTFKGRIAYSADGNHNDPDDWAASPVALAILAECGLKDRVVHFHYNCILPLTDPEWEKIHAESVLGTAERYGYDKSVFFDCRKDLEGTVAAIAQAVNESSADNPLYFIVAGPMQVPVMGLLKSNPEKQKYVYCISHSRWNDGFSSKYRYTHTKRDVIATGVNWVQIADQNRLLSLSPYGKPAVDDQWTAYHWMRDSKDPKVRWVWDRMRVSTRPDPSDAGMAYFLATGDEQCTPEKLRRLLDEKQSPPTAPTRTDIRIEAENFRTLEGYKLEDTDDRNASHRLQVTQTESSGRIRTPFMELFAADQGRYDVDIRYRAQGSARNLSWLRVNGKVQEPMWSAAGIDQGWMTATIPNVEIRSGDEIEIAAEGGPGKLDYVHLHALDTDKTATRFTATGPLDDPEALPGQIIVAGGRPGYLKYNGGRAAFLCGPDNPEEFLFLGTLNADGTRSGGGQEKLIEIMQKAGVNAFHCQMFRMKRCNFKNEGDDQHCPFTDFDPAKPLNEKILAQWDHWIGLLEKAGIVVQLEFYNDATDVERMGWTLTESGNLHPDEQRFFEGVVNRFKEHKNIIWGIEESLNKLPRSRTPHFRKLTELVARVDNRHHPIVHSFVTPETTERDFGGDKITSADYRDDPHVDIVTWLHVLPKGDDYEAQHREYLKYSQIDNDRFIVMKNETEKYPRALLQSRRYLWAAAMTGAHDMEAGLNAATRAQLLPDAGRVARFMEQTDVHTMRSADGRAAGSTKWVLAGKDSCIAYTYDCDGPMGVKNLPAGTYDLLWFDTLSGQQQEQQSVSVSGAESTWIRPAAFGREVALYVRRRS